MIKLIALDLDGTLLNSDKQLSQRNRAALQAAADSGIQVVPATGRFFAGMPEVIRTMPFINYVLTINGAQVVNVHTGEVIYEANLPLEIALPIMDMLSELPVCYDCYQDNDAFMTAALQERAAEFTDNPHYLKMLRELRKPVPELRAFLREKGRPIQKMQFFTRDEAFRQEALATFDARFPGTKATTSVQGNVEINAAEGNKGSGLMALAKHLGIAPEEIMAFGDGNNDVTMLEAVGMGVAMANAEPEAKAAAKVITASNDEDGVAQMIEKLLAGELEL